MHCPFDGAQLVQRVRHSRRTDTLSFCTKCIGNFLARTRCVERQQNQFMMRFDVVFNSLASAPFSNESENTFRSVETCIASAPAAAKNVDETFP